MKLKTCSTCKSYTMQETCPKCKKPTKYSHYKFKQLRDVATTFKRANRISNY